MSMRADLELNALDEQIMKQDPNRATAAMSAVASAAMVNRTHRVVRQRAQVIKERRTKMRSLWIPLGVSTTLLIILACALWTAFEDFEGTSAAGLPNTSGMVVFLVWSVPISAMILAVVWHRRANSRSENERVR
jgi:hypothetical protein